MQLSCLLWLLESIQFQTCSTNISTPYTYIYLYIYILCVTTLLTIAGLFQGQSSIHRSNRPVHRSGGSIESRVVTNVIDRVSMELHRCNFPFHSRIAYPCLPRVFDKQRSFVLRYVILCLFPTFIFIKRIQDYRVII